MQKQHFKKKGGKTREKKAKIVGEKSNCHNVVGALQ